MIDRVKLSPRKDARWGSYFSMLFMSLYFVYLLLRIDPQLIYQSQEPVFFFDRHFCRDFMRYPGGANALFSLFLAQFFYRAWTGALLLLALFTLIAQSTRRLLLAAGVRQPIFYLHWLPSLLLLALHSNYRFPLVFTTALCGTLLGVNLYVRRAPGKRFWRFIFYLVLFLILYYLIAAQALLFAVIVSLYELLHSRRFVLPMLYLLCAAALPFIAASALFIISVQEAYTSQLSSFAVFKVTWFSWALYAFYPLALLATSLAPCCARIKNKRMKELFDQICHLRSTRMQLLQGLLFFALGILVAVYAFDARRRDFLLVDRHARAGDWDKVLKMARKTHLRSDVALYQGNRALYHTGHLCDELFTLTQYLGGDGLFLHGNRYFHYPLQHSDLFFDLGLLNESEHWAYEALTVKGQTPWNLQRLALVNILEKNRGVAARYLDLLGKTMWHRAWAAEHRVYLTDAVDLTTLPQYRHLQSAVPAADFLLSPSEPERCLEELLKTSRNKMAYEYFMAHCLLAGKISQFMRHLNLLNLFGYPAMPRHFEEAILVYLQMTGRENGMLLAQVSEATRRKFADFDQILDKWGKDKIKAYDELRQKYEDTYWFYALYYYKEK